uniref:Conserved hypothetical cytosolic protein n=1 Tax=Solibacter usitatus (strain Ellin6076) TaxID=234267 RepID=Q02A81_SOLUE
MRSSAWTTPADLRAQLLRHWENGRILAAPESLFPMELRLRGPDTRALSERFEEVRTWIRELEAGHGYEIHWAEINHRQLGRNRIPARIVVASERDALELIGKVEEAARFRALAVCTLQTFPELAEWFDRRPLTALASAHEWDRVLAVLRWFREHPASGLYLRQLDIPGVDTKFIEQRKPLLATLLDVILTGERLGKTFEQRYGLATKPPQIRFRILDRNLAIAGLTDLALVPREFAALDLPALRVFLTENEINGLAFPKTPGSIVIFGLGYGLDRLADAKWLRGRELYYWGDIDTYGFHILDRLRALFPAARSFLMDRDTLLQHRDLWVTESNPCTVELTRLTPPELALYDELRYNRLGAQVRLEQERLPFGRVRNALSFVGS